LGAESKGKCPLGVLEVDEFAPGTRNEVHIMKKKGEFDISSWLGVEELSSCRKVTGTGWVLE